MHTDDRQEDSTPFFTLDEGRGPLIATAIHHGNAVRPEVHSRLKLSDEERLREEDPFTGWWTTVADTRVIGRRSRFEVDLNRPREKAVYLAPSDAWGLDVWEKQPSHELVDESLDQYDTFYERMHGLLTRMADRHGAFIIYDLHSYNHRREGPEADADDPEENPEINVGTGSLDRERWGPVVDRFMSEATAFDFHGRSLDVRENVRFTGGHFSQWVHEHFPGRGCVLAIEVKKFFMDEWAGEVNEEKADRVRSMLRATIPGVTKSLSSCLSATARS